MNPTIQRYLVSSLTTFLTSFLGILALQISAAGNVEFTYAFWFGVVGVAARAAIKAVIEAIPTLGRASLGKAGRK